MDQQPRRNEKEEKNREKREKGQPNDELTGLTWGAIFIIAGIIFLLVSLNVFSGLNYGDAWGLAFLAAGIILLLNAAVRLLMPAHRGPVTGTLILAFIFLGIGVGITIGFQYVWPLIIIAIGAIILVGQFVRR